MAQSPFAWDLQEQLCQLTIEHSVTGERVRANERSHAGQIRGRIPPFAGVMGSFM